MTLWRMTTWINSINGWRMKQKIHSEGSIMMWASTCTRNSNMELVQLTHSIKNPKPLIVRTIVAQMKLTRLWTNVWVNFCLTQEKTSSLQLTRLSSTLTSSTLDYCPATVRMLRCNVQMNQILLILWLRKAHLCNSFGSITTLSQTRSICI